MLLVTTWGTACGIAPEQLAARIRVLSSGCWLWTGTIGYWGYGQFASRGKTYRAHRLVYEAVRGSVPSTLDHLCRNKLCVNPDHLEAVSVRENTLRGVGPAAQNVRKQYCTRGHQLVGENLRTKQGRYGLLRVCRACAKDQARQRFQLFCALHPLVNRDQHWQQRKSRDCPHCAAFLEAT